MSRLYIDYNRFANAFNSEEIYLKLMRSSVWSNLTGYRITGYNVRISTPS